MSTIKFCPQCNNELYTTEEDEVLKIVSYACRRCDDRVFFLLMPDSNLVDQEIADNRNVIQHYVVSAEQKLYHSTRLAQCPKCGHRDTKFFWLTTRSGIPAGLSFICCNSDCLHRFWDDDSWIDDYVCSSIKYRRVPF